MKRKALLSFLFAILFSSLAFGKPLDDVCQGDFNLTSQAEVDGFNCTEVSGNLTISGGDIFDLSSLSSLTKVSGKLTIENNPHLQTADGLDACTGMFVLSSQAEVDAFLCGELDGSLTISGPDITNLKSLALLKKISGSLLIRNNPVLETLDDISRVETSGALLITGNAKLISISGFDNVVSATGIYIQDNPKLASISGFGSLKKVASHYADGTLVIGQNNSLTNVTAFGALETTENFRIDNNAQLLALDGFPSLTLVFGKFQISNNESLKTINGFNELMSISGVPKLVFDAELFIENNPSLETLGGLSSLRSMSAPLYEYSTPPVEGRVTINVTGNSKLAECCVLQPLLDALHTGGKLPPHFSVNISKNGSTCNFIDILECGQQRIVNFTLLNHQTKEVIANFQDKITIDIADPRFSHLLLQANTGPEYVGSVEFVFDGRIKRTENGFPYQFLLPQLTLGTHTAAADVYSQHQLKGEKGNGKVATFTVINSVRIFNFFVVDQSGQILMALNDGDKINIKDPAFRTFLFRANTVLNRIDKMEFYLNNRLVATEYGFPFEVYGKRTPGDYTLEAIPYVKTGANQYVPGTSLKVQFKVVSEDPGSTNLVMNQPNDESLLKESEEEGVTIFPVPVDNELFLEIGDEAGDDPLITIRSIHGLTVYQNPYSKSRSINTLLFPAGVYYLRVAGHGGFQKIVRFIKM